MKLFKYLFLFILAGIIIGTKPIEPSAKYNVLFIVADDLNCAIGAYGDPLAKTPNLDRLAKEGLLFSDAHVQYPLCGPSRVSFMTGIYPDQTKSKELRLYVRQTIPDVVTLGQKLRIESSQRTFFRIPFKDKSSILMVVPEGIDESIESFYLSLIHI